VHERTAVVIRVALDDAGVGANPAFEAALLFGVRNASLTIVGINRGLEVIRESDTGNGDG